MPAPQQIIELVNRFERNFESYKSSNYNETQTRREFIDPFFEALGWDVSNRLGYAEAYKDVVHEYSQKTTDSVEAPDYLFRIGGTRKFFIEAKKPSVKLADDISPAYQLRRYAWTAKLPLSILTDFEELAVYDCRIKPSKNDKSSAARINYYTYKDFIDKWDEIESLFSKDAILKGSFDKFAESKKGKRGTAEVDDEFLKEIEAWRETLAKNIALRNPDLSNRELNYAVQKIIDRIIFLRICEDRGIEDYGQLMNLQNGVNVYKRLLQIFTRADEKYNSGLFHFENEKDRPESPDEITPQLSIDDKTLKDIIKTLYYPESPYEFSVLPADILGHVYEQFLGKIIRLTPAHQAKIDEKPEVKKAGGVYYTPTYIVDYIVKNTLSKLLTEDKTPKQVSKITVLDPACGSGSFLIVDYQYLLDWHLKFYISNDPEKHAQSKNPPVYISSNGEWKLITSERKRILLNNIYGVDIDHQAVEVTKLSLLLKVLEGETEETLSSQFKFFRERALPDLGSNIKCGNSLIGSDFYQQTELNLITDEERMRINMFDWHKEFPEVFNDSPSASSGQGFDVAIENPPWGAEFQEYEKKYLTRYASFGGNYDSYLFFIDKVIKIAGTNSWIGFITPDSWLKVPQAKNLRKVILDKTAIDEIVVLPEKVFKGVNANCIISLYQNLSKNNNVEIKFLNSKAHLNLLKIGAFEKKYTLNKSDWYNNENIQFQIHQDDRVASIINKIKSSPIMFRNFLDVMQGIVPYSKEMHSQSIINERAFHSKIKTDNNFGPWVKGRAIKRYKYEITTIEFLNYGPWLHRPRQKKYFEGPRIIIQEITGGEPPRINATYIEEQLYHDPGIISCLNNSKLSTFFFLGILNSTLISWYHRFSSPKGTRSMFPKLLINDIRTFPLPMDFEKDSIHISKIEEKVKLIIKLIREYDRITLYQEKESLQRQIDATDREIDRLVYELYGLTEEEIKIVESP